MSLNVVRQIKNALSNLDPEEVYLEAQRPLKIGLVAPDSSTYALMEDFLAPPDVSPARRLQIAGSLYRSGDLGSPPDFDLEIYAAGLYPGREGFTFYPQNPERMVEEILNRREDLSLALSRLLPAFRHPVAKDRIARISKENALFCLLTAFPNVIPNVFSLPWAVGEFASDTAVLTTNQVRLAFLLAAASDRDVGYREQKGEIASIVAGAFGWRTLARELVGKIPLGGGLIPKAAIGYAGTYVVGLSLERFYRVGHALTREERSEAYSAAYERGKSIVKHLMHLMSREPEEDAEREAPVVEPAGSRP